MNKTDDSMNSSSLNLSVRSKKKKKKKKKELLISNRPKF
jgi:hypothetical protein